MTEFARLPVFMDMSPAEVESFLALAQMRHLAAGETLFQEGDIPAGLWLLRGGRLMLSRDVQPEGPAQPDTLLDMIASLGGLPHTRRAIALSDCALLHWPASALDSPPFAAAARRYLSGALLQTGERLAALEAPVHYAGDDAGLPPGPFAFDDVTLVMAFCDAERDALDLPLPDGIARFRGPGGGRGGVLLALADFPQAYPDHTPQARFAYTETTCFIPVRRGWRLGLYPAYIYPSAWEPILLGREIYGFPKRLGNTVFSEKSVALSVDETPYAALIWNSETNASEPRLLRAFSDWLGIEGRITETAFRVGDFLLEAMRSRLYRRISVYNHKRITGAASTLARPVYDVDMLTQAIFSIVHWERITRLQDAALTIPDGPLRHAGLRLREAFYTRLEMRLSTGRVIRDYR